MSRLTTCVLVLICSSAALCFADTARVSASASTTLRVTGTIESYDPATRTISLATPTEIRRFTLAPSVRLRQGWRRLDASELPKLIGCRASIRYLDEAGARTVESIHVRPREHEDR